MHIYIYHSVKLCWYPQTNKHAYTPHIPFLVTNKATCTHTHAPIDTHLPIPLNKKHTCTPTHRHTLTYHTNQETYTCTPHTHTQTHTGAVGSSGWHPSYGKHSWTINLISIMVTHEWNAAWCFMMANWWWYAPNVAVIDMDRTKEHTPNWCGFVLNEMKGNSGKDLIIPPCGFRSCVPY